MLTDFLNQFVHPSLHKAARDYLTNALPSEASSATADSESATQAAVVLQSGEYRQRLWRNNNVAFQDPETGRQVRAGLGNTSKRINDKMKSSDYIGITTITVQPHHVGQQLGVFTALEFKAPGWKLTAGDKRGNAQAAFGVMVEAAGGIFGFISEPGQYVAMLQRWSVIPPQ